ncbi:MAG: PEGA domain-containing protein [Deltaproteobacteria bacterium]|nr:PEGA domain-containing protein [Deltaproteobacteria bacterium]
MCSTMKAPRRESRFLSPRHGFRRRSARRSSAFLLILAMSLTTSAWGQHIAKIPAWAKVKTVTTVLFPLESAQIPSLTREVVELASGLGRQVKPASLSPEEVMLAVGCNTYSVACLQQVGKMIRAPALILGKVKALPDGSVHLRLRRFDVVSGGDAGLAVVVLPPAPVARRVRLLAALRILFNIPALRPQVQPRQQQGEVVITASAPNATILLNGQPRGTAPLVLSGLTAGTYTVGAVKQGYDDWQGKIVVGPGPVRRLRIMMRRQPGASVGDPGFFGSVQPQTWIVGGLALTSFAIGVGFAADLSSRQNDFDRIEGNTPFEILELQDLKDTGERDALVANVMFAVGGALLATAGLLAYLDYRNSAPLRKHASSAAPSKAPGSVVSSVALDGTPTSETSWTSRVRLGVGSFGFVF